MNKEKNAVTFWNNQWKSEDTHGDWVAPETYVEKRITSYIERGFKRVLDLGAGVGRHALLFATRGFDVEAFDGSEEGMEFLDNKARAMDLTLRCKVGDFTQLDYENEAFDLVLSWNVIYHGNMNSLKEAFEEVYRLLIPGGIFQGTLLSKRNVNFGIGREISENTWVADDDKSDKSHPHCYLDEWEVEHLTKGWEMIALEEVDLGNYSGAYHWHFVAKKPIV